MEGYRGKSRRGDVRGEVWEARGRSRRNDRKEGKASATKQGGIGKILGFVRGIEGPMEFAKMLQLRFRVDDLGQPERRET